MYKRLMFYVCMVFQSRRRERLVTDGFSVFIIVEKHTQFVSESVIYSLMASGTVHKIINILVNCRYNENGNYFKNDNLNDTEITLQ